MQIQLFILSGALFWSYIKSDLIQDNIQKVKEKSHKKYLDEFQKIYGIAGNGGANTGGGGGGVWGNTVSGYGGSGIVIFSFANII